MTAINHTTLITRDAKLTWACRRGMLELDVLLNNFLKTAYNLLGEVDRTTFKQLLDLEDSILFDWFFSEDTETPHQFKQIVDYIKKCHHSF